MKHRIICRVKPFMALALLCLTILSLLTGCTQNKESVTLPFDYMTNIRQTDHIVICINDEYSPCPAAVVEMLPSYTVDSAENRALPYLEAGAATEAFGAQAAPALEAGLAKYWYPQYLATVVIAIDRDKTDAIVNSWSDLPAANVPVGYNDTNINRQLLIAAIAYGLEGDGFTLCSAMKLLAALHTHGNLKVGTFELPIVICYDYQATALIKDGRNIEIVIPAEGTLTYEKGLLSNTELTFWDDVSNTLLNAGFRLTDGRRDASIYPTASTYENAAVVTATDYAHLNTVVQDTTRLLRTDVLKIRLYSSKDNRQHQYFVLIYIAIVVLWLATIIYRSLNDSAKRAAMIAGAILLGWICVRLIKYQFVFADIWNRHLMYAYYPFQLALPLVLLWLAWAIDKPGDAKLSMPNWLKITIVVNAVIAVLVLTNELHYLVFPIAGLTPSGSVQHGYGIGHYFVLAGSVLPVLAALIILFKNNRENTRKSGLLFTLAFVLLLAAYGYGYINRIPIAWESDRTMVIGLFTLIFTEVLIRAGVIPVNTKYNALFANSPLGVSITDKDRQTVWASATVPHDSARNQEVFAQALASFPIPAQQDENTLLFATDITGGYVQWQEDISDLNRLHQEIASSVEKLTAANTMLSEEESIKRAALEETEKTKIMEQLEAEIPEHITKLSVMIEHLESQEDNPSAVARIILLLCYVKRRCGLFFREKEAAAIPHYELSLYLDELAKTTECSEKVIVTSELNSPVPVRYATLIYDVFNNVFDWAMGLGDPQMLAHLRIKGDYLVLGIFPSSDVRTFQLDTVLQTAIAQVGGIYEVVDLDEEVGLRFSFPIGGEANG